MSFNNIPIMTAIIATRINPRLGGVSSGNGDDTKTALIILVITIGLAVFLLLSLLIYIIIADRYGKIEKTETVSYGVVESIEKQTYKSDYWRMITSTNFENNIYDYANVPQVGDSVFEIITTYPLKKKHVLKMGLIIEPYYTGYRFIHWWRK